MPINTRKMLNISNKGITKLKLHWVTFILAFTSLKLKRQDWIELNWMSRMQINRDFHIILLMRMQNFSLQKAICLFIMKRNTHLIRNPAIPLLGIYSRDKKTYLQKIYIQDLIALLIITKNWKPKSPSTSE